MRPFMSLLLSLLFLLLNSNSSPVVEAAHKDIIHETCKKCTDSDPNLAYDFCVATLQSKPKSHKASLKGLGVISLRLAISNATHTRKTIKKLMKTQPQERYLKSCYDTCLELYLDSISSLRDSVKAYKAGSYDDVNAWISSALDAPDECEDNFNEGGLDSPLTKENKDFSDLTLIALDITNLH